MLSLLLLVLPIVVAQNSSAVASTPTAASTAVPSTTQPADTVVRGQDVYPPPQWWCPSGFYCPGQLLQDVELAAIFPDSKTFVDKPTNRTNNATVAVFNQIAQGGNVTVGQMETFVSQNFKGEGLELMEVQIENFNPNPGFLNNINDPIFKAWTGKVHGYWSLLIRETNKSAVCQPDTCESSLIPFNHTIVVPGGRYRELYYWDSYWIMQGLLQSELYQYAWNLLQNFMDTIELYGFMPNGGRKYYLNRSQPPVFVQMVDSYVKVTGNASVLERALPILEKEMDFFLHNRTMNITSPFTGKQLLAAHYAANNTAPRPEGFVEDWTTAFGASPALNATERENLWAELASGAESGWDYSSRWCRQPIINISDNNPTLRTLNVRGTIPVDLNALLAGNHRILANFYETMGNSSSSGNSSDGSGGSSSGDRVAYHQKMAQQYTDTVLDLNWDPAKSFFYDFNMSSNSRSEVYSPAGFWPVWQNITPELNESVANQMASGLVYLINRYAGVPTVASVLETGLNWDFPNSWPVHAHTTIVALENLGRLGNISSSMTNLTVAWDQIPPNQLGVNEADLPAQPAESVGNASVGVVTSGDDEPWTSQLATAVANRYLTAAFCSWYSTGGSLPGLLSQLPLSDLNATGTYQTGTEGVMFEKFNVTDPDAAGGGGEYTVQVGFGWTNGVALWAAAHYGQHLSTPSCPMIPILENPQAANGTGNATADGGAARFIAHRLSSDWRFRR